MMDMMTILLVAFIFQAATSATALTAGAVALPKSLSDDELPEGASTLIITQDRHRGRGQVDRLGPQRRCRRRREGRRRHGLKIPRLTNFLAALRRRKSSEAASGPGTTRPRPPPPELMIIADRTTPYRLLLQVMFSAKQKEAGYKRFRLIVQKSQLVTPGT